jgi:hypothetical protein
MSFSTLFLTHLSKSFPSPFPNFDLFRVKEASSLRQVLAVREWASHVDVIVKGPMLRTSLSALTVR